MNHTNESIGRAFEILRMVVDGRISGRISEWPQLKWACEEAVRELGRQAPGECNRCGGTGRRWNNAAEEEAECGKCAPQPPAQEQGEVLDTLADAPKWKAMPLYRRLGIHADSCALVCDESKDAVLSKHEIRAMHDDLREAITAITRAAGAEDARDAENAAIADAFREWERRSNYWRGQRNARLWIREKADAAIASQAKEGEGNGNR